MTTDPYAPFGGKLPPEIISAWGLTYIRSALKLLSNVRPTRPLRQNELPSGNVTFEFINNLSFNAIAFAIGKMDYIGINFGVVYTHTLFSSLFMQDPLTFSNIGEVDDAVSPLARSVLKSLQSSSMYEEPQASPHFF